MRPLLIVDLGRMPYDDALAVQENTLAARSEGRVPDLLLLVEHPPVYTLGRGAREEHLLVSEAELAARGASLRRVSRGGDITFHGPGQLVGYPILDLNEHGRDLHRYLRGVEQSLIDALTRFGVASERVSGLTGVWVGDRKIAAIGVAVRRWITYHGFALNVAVDLAWFDAIVPCGIRDRGVTSLDQLTAAPPLGKVAEVVAREFATRFGLRAEWVERGQVDQT